MRESRLGRARAVLLLLLAVVLFESVASAEQAETFVFVCDEKTSYPVQATRSEAWVFRPEGSLRLKAAPSDEGRRYTDGSFEILIDGQLAWLGDLSGKPQACRNDARRAVWERAKLEGVNFRAVGNEPGWYLEIRELSRMVLVADYGASRVEVPLPEPSVDPDRGITRWDGGELVVQVTARDCRDTMSGERFPSQVVVLWRGRVLRGCGRPLH